LFCRCLHYFSSNAKLETNAVDCEAINDCAIRLSSEDDKWLSFKNHCRKERMPFILYADLECILEKTETEETSSHKYQYHRVFSLAYYIGWKVPGFLMKTSVFWAKLYLFLNIVAFEGDTLGIAIFQQFDALSVIRNVQAFEIRLGFRDDFLIRSESLSLEPLEVWNR